NFVNNFLKTEKTIAACVAFVSPHHTCPLLTAHGAGAAISQQIDGHILCPNQKWIIMGLFQNAFTLLARGKINRLNRLDSERFNYGIHGKKSSKALSIVKQQKMQPGFYKRGCIPFCTLTTMAV